MGPSDGPGGAGRRRARAERCHAVPRMPQLPFGTQMCYNKGHLAPPHRNGELFQLQLCVVTRPIGGRAPGVD